MAQYLNEMAQNWTEMTQYWTEMAQDTLQWWMFMNTVRTLRVT
jgi:hypothetical protein